MSRIFADDWRDCLREQYKYVIQQQDARTEATLVKVLTEVGFSDDELAALRLEATMRAEDMPDDYVPEEVRGQVYVGVEVTEPEPVEASEVVAVTVLEDEEEAAEPEIITFDELVAEESTEEPADDFEDNHDDEPDSPQQLSLF